MDDVAVADDWQFKCADDVYTDARQLCVCEQFGSEAGAGGVERLGAIYFDGVFAGVLTDYVSVVLVER
jgi:hypothetical protein